MTKGTALITGASGFIGGRIRDALLGRGMDVVAIRRKGSPHSKNGPPKNGPPKNGPAKKGRSVEADYEDVAGLERAVGEAKPDWVIHVAGATKGVTYDDFRRANVMPTKNLLDAVARAHPQVKRFVHLSSLTSYGPSTADRPLVESDPRRPIEFYGQSKLEADHAVEVRRDLPWTILRPGGVYGPGDVDYFELFKEISRGRNVFFGNRKRWFSAVYVDDLVDAVIASATNDAAVGKGFFVCDGVPITWERFQGAIVEVAGRKVRDIDLPEFLTSIAAVSGELATRVDGKPRLFNRQKAKMGAQGAWTCRSDAIRTALGWKSEFPVARGAREALEWYRREGWI
jgi:nucleoside-diphosphate-sugar epimerase